MISKRSSREARRKAEAEGKDFDEEQHLSSTFNGEERAAIQAANPDRTDSSSKEASSDSSRSFERTPEKLVEGGAEAATKVAA